MENGQLTHDPEQRRTILVADDDYAILDAIQIMLVDAGYVVQTTSDGKNVLKNSQAYPDLILLDVWMSGVDGRDVCKKIKSDPATKHIPIILFSANRDTHKIAEEAGADDYIIKPFDMDELLEKVKRNITRNNSV